MNELNLTEEWYRNALEIEGDAEVGAGPPAFCFYDRKIGTKADQIAASAGVSLKEGSLALRYDLPSCGEIEG